MPLYNGQQDPLAHVVSFLEKTISGYAIGDIRRLGEIRPDANKPNLRGCAVPECLAIFAVLDLIGFLMRGDFDDEAELDIETLISDQIDYAEPSPTDYNILKKIRREAQKTADNLKYIFENWLWDQSKDYDELARDLLINLFRHGGSHQFLPKASGIAKWGKTRPLIEFQKAKDGFPLPILNEDRFREDVIIALERIIQIMKHWDNESLMVICQNTVEQMATRMSKRLSIRHWLDRDMLRSTLLTHRPDLLHANIFWDIRPVLPTV
jgi:hypothetical protein